MASLPCLGNRPFRTRISKINFLILEISSRQLRCTCCRSSLGGDVSRESNVDLSFDVPPLFRLTENTYKFLKRVDFRWSIFEPGKEIEGLTEIATVVEATRDCWDVFQADPDVSRSGFEYRPPLTLAKLPPGFRLRDWNKGGTGGFWPSYGSWRDKSVSRSFRVV